MKMSNALRRSLLEMFPNGTIYSTELCRNTELRKTIGVHYALCSEAKKAGMSPRQLAEENGFVWKETEPVMDYSGEPAVQASDAVSIVKQIYASQAFLGNAILTEEQHGALYAYAKEAFERHFVYDKSLTIIEQKAIILEAIYALQNRHIESEEDVELQSKIWAYLFKHFCGYTIEQNSTEYQRYYRYFCKTIKEVMNRTKHLLVPSKFKGTRYQGYYDTLMIHALEPADAVNRFFSILFDFYVNTLDCQYISGDPALKLLVKAIKAKWNTSFDSDVNIRSVTVSSSFRTLLELCQGYSYEFCADIIRKMDIIASGYKIDDQLDTKHCRIDLLIYQWFQQRSITQQKQAQDRREKHRNDRVAIHKSDISASYELVDEAACIVLPKIRFEEEDCQLISAKNPPLAIIFLDDEQVGVEKMKIFGDEIYTSREYRFMLDQQQGGTFHFSIKIVIGEQGHEVYDSGKSLYRDYLILSRDFGHEIRNVQKTAHGSAYLFAPLNADVEFGIDSGNFYEEGCRFARKFAIDVNELHCLTINGDELYADDTIKNRLRFIVHPQKIQSATILSGIDVYTVHSEVNGIDIVLPEDERQEKYRVLIDGESLPLAVFLKGRNTYLPTANKAGAHRVEVVDLTDSKTVCIYDYFIIPGFTCTILSDHANALRYPICFDEGKTITVQTYDTCNGNRDFTIYSNPGDDTIQIPGFLGSAILQLDLPVVRASLLQNGQNKNMFTLENRDIWADDWKSDVFIHIECPKGWTVRLFLGRKELVCAKASHLFEIGNFIQANRSDRGKADLVIRLEQAGGEPICHPILTVHFSPSFRECPLFYENGGLFWKIEDNFIGNIDQDFHLYLYDVEEKPYHYSLSGKNEKLENRLFLPNGIYKFAVTETINGIFSKKELEIYAGRLTVGNPYDFKYRNAILNLKSASCWDWKKGVFHVLGLQKETTRIVDLKYIECSVAPAGEDGECPHYQGTLQFWNVRRAAWFSFCSDRAKTEFELINPVDIWLINDHFLAMYSATGDAVYIDSSHGSILNKAEHTLSSSERRALQIPDKFEYDITRCK